MNNEHLKASTSWDTVQTLHSKLNRLEARLAEVEKERDEAKELFKVFCDRAEFADKEAATAQAQLRRKDEALDKIERLSIGGDIYQAFATAQEIARAAVADGKEGGK